MQSVTTNQAMFGLNIGERQTKWELDVKWEK
jgi:hypothetical protein